MPAALAVVAALMVIVDPLVSLALALLLGRAAGAIAPTVMAALSVLPFIATAAVAKCFDALMTLL